ncbi:hypothetical protein [Lentilactobacillus kosonis]|uniref:Uncharacterized protein n=1 Tax=Lentilactobacillus kosonis TaxID=2810561 RepID=A0A401FPZ8_9LACO|nr:hypothetical protein [Lentilactobacillus kosonis]GAY74406.1 hypothetical protein NBRC111893_2552 [Lentilactobacillus kosonis]
MKRTDIRQKKEVFPDGHATQLLGYQLLGISVILIGLLALAAHILM